ncbi:LBP / BPI / CETP family protein [Dictyocaulus viviparus]|uniref:LBP / BPI / CETP family protein n=1 Tax=Dictyocaulus viviparus TaxID=29172 RepID=A0A0D8Y0Z8_DICVI|nr:LBP / BPI / CETP family protein [Dictyocaulus viviparus]
MRAALVALEIAALVQLMFSIQDFHPLLEASPHSPGVRLRLFPSGISYLSKVASNVLAEQLPRLFIPDVVHRLPGDQGVIYISQVKISRTLGFSTIKTFHVDLDFPPTWSQTIVFLTRIIVFAKFIHLRYLRFRRAESETVTTYAPNRISWLMKNFDLGFIGDLSGAVDIVVPFNLSGQAEVHAQGLSVQLDSAIGSGMNGSAHVKTISCHSTIRAVDVTNHNGGLFGLAVTVFKQSVSDNVRQLLQGLICKKVRKYLDEDLNEKLAEVQTRSRLSDAIETNSIKSTKVPSSFGGFMLGSLLGKSMYNDFYIDFRLREEPRCGLNTVDIACAGEISYKGLGGTPFGPPAIEWQRRPSDSHMLILQLSDYLPNSLLYHAHKQRIIRLHLTPSTPGLFQFLRTTCENSFCVADLVPQLAETYPNRTLELSLISTRAPAVLFLEKKGGVISVNLAGVMVLFVLEGLRRKQLIVLDVELVADAKLSLQVNRIKTLKNGSKTTIAQNQNVSGRVELTKFELSSRSTTVEISEVELSDISILVSQFLENMLNELLASGFPVPLPSGKILLPNGNCLTSKIKRFP